MRLLADVWLRGDNFATTETIDRVTTAPTEWTDDDVHFVLEEMLRTMNRLKHPDEADRSVALIKMIGTYLNATTQGGKRAFKKPEAKRRRQYLAVIRGAQMARKA